jgi:hypothetical protein
MRALLALSIGDITFEVWKKKLMNRKKKKKKREVFLVTLFSVYQ